jgi:hypothetical protein
LPARCSERLPSLAFSRSSARGTRIANPPREDTSIFFYRHEDSHEIALVADPRDLRLDCSPCRFADPGGCAAQSAADARSYEGGALIVPVRDGDRCACERCSPAKRASHRTPGDDVVCGPRTFVRPDAGRRSFAGRSSAEWHSHGLRPNGLLASALLECRDGSNGFDPARAALHCIYPFAARPVLVVATGAARRVRR